MSMTDGTADTPEDWEDNAMLREAERLRRVRHNAYEAHWRAVTIGPADGHSNVMDGTPYGYGGCPHTACVAARRGLSHAEPAEAPADLQFESDEYGRPVVYLAQWEWYGGASTGFCLFSTRDLAVKWARQNIAGRMFKPEQPRNEYDGRYPNEYERDDVRLSPTFRVEWFDNGKGKVEVYRCTVVVSDTGGEFKANPSRALARAARPEGQEP